jgi:hypothetical protein
MSAVLTSLAGGAFSLVDNSLTLIPQGSIGGISIQATIEEEASDTLTVTDHPVEAGAQISDHAFVKPAELVMRCGWSNANGASAIASLFSGGGAPSNGGPSVPGLSVSDYVSGIYSQLLALQQTLLPFTVQTSIRRYTNMMFQALHLTRDQKTSQALMVVASLRQVIIVQTQSTTLAPIANQALPQSTGETTNVGPQQLQSNVSPAPGGSVPPVSWPEGSDEAAGIFYPGELQ